MQFFLHCTFQIHYQHCHHSAHIMFLTPIEHLNDHNYCIKQDTNTTTGYIIDQQYADDIGFISNNKNIINKAMRNSAQITEQGNLTINAKKTQYNIQLTEHKKMTGRSVNTLEHY